MKNPKKELSVKIEKAKVKDAKDISNLTAEYSRKGLMLYRPIEKIEQNIRDYFICKLKNKNIVGCAGLRVWNKKTAEIYAIAVNKKYLGKRIGTKLVKACVAEAKKLGVKSVFTLTFRKNIFVRLGFKKIRIKDLPKIIFTEKTIDIDKAYGLELK